MCFQMEQALIELSCQFCSQWQFIFSRKDYQPPCSRCLLANSKTWTYLAFDLSPSLARMCSLRYRYLFETFMIRRLLRQQPCPTLSLPREFPAALLQKWTASTTCQSTVYHLPLRTVLHLHPAYSWSSTSSRTWMRDFWRLFTLNSSFFYLISYGYFLYKK